MLYESIKYCLEARRRQHMRQHEKTIKMSPKIHQNDWIQVEFLKFFWKPQFGFYGCSMMYFDVLELWEL